MLFSLDEISIFKFMIDWDLPFQHLKSEQAIVIAATVMDRDFFSEIKSVINQRAVLHVHTELLCSPPFAITCSTPDCYTHSSCNLFSLQTVGTGCKSAYEQDPRLSLSCIEAGRSG